MTWISSGTATGMGSLPHQNMTCALQVIAQAIPQWPHWPQLPAKSSEQGFLLQYVQPLVKLGLLQDNQHKDPVFTRNTVDWDKNLVQFYELYLAFLAGDSAAEDFFASEGAAFSGLDQFLDNFSSRFPLAQGVKGQLSGPLTVALQIKDERGRSAFYDDTLRDILVKCLMIQGIMQVRRLQSTGLKVLLMIDDPSIYLLGTAAYITLTREAIGAALTEIIEPLTQMGAKVGVHICAQADWTLLFDLPLDVISFDAYQFFPSMASCSTALQQFILRGGKMAWGLIPTAETAWQITADDLVRLFKTQCADLECRGLNIDLLQKNIIWTPSCGTGTLSVELAEHIYHLLADFSKMVNRPTC
jgi:hypothetical protein